MSLLSTRIQTTEPAWKPEHFNTLRIRDRERKLLGKIEAALQRIEDGTFGICEITGEPIERKRLEARPVTTLSLKAKEEQELEERRQHR
jgi:DnaK suppressor protein